MFFQNFSIKFSIVFLSISFSCGVLQSQDTAYVRKVVNVLTSPEMYGRAYINKGDSLAADFIASEFKKLNLLSFDKNYYQNFQISTNTYPGKMDLSINDSILLKTFFDFRIVPSSKGIKGIYELKEVPYKELTSVRKLRKRLSKNDYINSIVYFDFSKASEKERKKLEFQNQKMLAQINVFDSKGILIIDKTLPAWGLSAGKTLRPDILVNVLAENFPKTPKTIRLNVENQYYSSYKTQNVMAYIKGKHQPDTFLVLGAHYDHLGMMGSDVYFPGANDNASGTATVLDLARYYSQPENQPYYSMAFILFSAEEAGILGSKFYTENPYFPLKNIKFMLNLDMVGAGDRGLAVVNAIPNEKAYCIIDSLNTEYKYFPTLRKRGEAANSDHYFFHAQGVPAFFFYTMGDSGPYHHPHDDSNRLTLSAYSNLFEIITKFVEIYR